MAREQLHGRAPYGPHVQVFLVALAPQEDVWRSVIGRAYSDVVIAGAKLLRQPDLGAWHLHTAEVGDHHLRRGADGGEGSDSDDDDDDDGDDDGDDDDDDDHDDDDDGGDDDLTSNMLC